MQKPCRGRVYLAAQLVTATYVPRAPIVLRPAQISAAGLENDRATAQTSKSGEPFPNTRNRQHQELRFRAVPLSHRSGAD